MKFLSIDFRPGFVVYKNGDGPVWVCPHSGPAMETPTSRDENSETVASLCWLKIGGTLITSSVPRKMTYGIDYNRDPPDTSSVNMWDDFIKNGYSKRLESYRKKYSWVPKDMEDHRCRLRIYNDFWRTVMRSGNIIIFVHRKFTRMKNFPSILDIITYQGEGVNKEIIKAIVRKVNKKYEGFFSKIRKDYNDAIMLEQKRIAGRIKQIFSDFDIEKMKVEYKENILEDMEKIRKYGDKEKFRKLKRNFNEKNFFSAIRSVFKHRINPRITVESIFKGAKAVKKKKELMSGKKIVMEIECTNFMNYWYPGVMSDIIIDLLKHLVSVDIYKRLGVKQTQIMKFVKK
jgi:hypothetical protein